MANHEVSPAADAGAGEWWTRENLDPRHFYAGYTFDDAETRQSDVVTLIDEARRLGYSVRYWWLSDAVELEDAPDRLVICVHHPATDENAGMDLYEALKRRGVAWDDLEHASLEEYLLYSKTINGTSGISQPDGQLLFPSPTQVTANEPTKPLTREDEPLFVLTLGDIQTVALDKLGRYLTEPELKSVMKTLLEPFDWSFLLRMAIQACQMNGTVGPSAAEQEQPEAELPTPPDEGEPFPLLDSDELAPRIAYLVYYRLAGMTLAHAPSEVKASESVFADLHRLIGRAGMEGVTAEEANRLRLSDLEVYIESVESTEFPLDEV
jgi:hypothetical protein